jgi:iron(III) transport system substrate-binding protein
MRHRTAARVGTVLWLGALAACGGDDRTRLVVYSPHGRDLLALLERAFEERRPDLDVRWLDMGSQEVLDRVRSERANPQADIWFGGPHTIFARGAAEGLLEPYRPSWADAIVPGGADPEARFFAAYLTPAVLVYNTDALSADEAPRDWDDLLDPRFRGRVLIRDPLASGTMRAFFGMVLGRSLRETGDTAQGMAWLRRLDAQTREYVLNPALLYEKLSRGEGWLTVWDLPDILLVQAQGRPLAYVLPASGTPVILDAIGLVRGAPHPDAARAFLEFVGTPEAQLLAAHEAYRLPARTDLPPDALPEWARDVLAALVPAEIDWATLAERGDEWMRWWDRHVRGTGARAAR